MIEDNPVRAIQSAIEGKVTYPRALLTHWALAPVVVVISLETGRFLEKMGSQSLKEQAGDKTIQIAFVRQDDRGLGKTLHCEKVNLGQDHTPVGISRKRTSQKGRPFVNSI